MRDYCGFKKKHKAFSLVELMAVIAIIGIMSAVAFVSLNSTNSASRLKTAQREVTATIKLAQAYALQGKRQGGVTPCGYGFMFNNNTDYFIYYNLPGVNPGEDCASKNDEANPGTWRRYNPPGPDKSEIAESFSLKNGVVKSAPNPSWGNEIYFTVPHANIFHATGGGSTNRGVLFTGTKTFTLSISGVTKTIILNQGGYVTEN